MRMHPYAALIIGVLLYSPAATSGLVPVGPPEGELISTSVPPDQSDSPVLTEADQQQRARQERFASKRVEEMKPESLAVLLYMRSFIREQVFEQVGKPKPRGEFETDDAYKVRKRQFETDRSTAVDAACAAASQTAYRVRMPATLGSYDMENGCFEFLRAKSPNLHTSKMGGSPPRLPSVTSIDDGDSSVVAWKWWYNVIFRTDSIDYFLEARVSYAGNLCLPVEDAQALRDSGAPITATVVYYSDGNAVYDHVSVQWSGLGALGR